jgi:hypothetical protein
MTDENKPVENTAAPAPEGAPAELTINDLNAIKTIIDVASTRGAFRANEMESVGKVFNKLNSFLESVTPKQPEGEAAQQPAQTAPQTEQPAQQPAQ